MRHGQIGANGLQTTAAKPLVNPSLQKGEGAEWQHRVRSKVLVKKAGGKACPELVEGRSAFRRMEAWL